MRREAKEMKNVSSHVAVKERKDRIAVYIQKFSIIGLYKRVKFD